MRQLLITGIFWAGILCSNFCYGQRAPLGSMPMEYNSSFAGEGKFPRINSNFSYAGERYYYRDLRFQTSYDQFIPAIRSGIGITAGTGRASYRGDTRFFHSSFGIAIAPKLSLGGNITISPSLDYHYFKQESSGNHEITGFRTRGAILINTSKFYIGWSVDLYRKFNSNDSTFSLSYNFPKDIRSFIQMGYTFQRSPESKFSFTPQILFIIDKSWPQKKYYIGPELIMLNFRYNKFLWGASSAGPHVGWQTENMKVMLSKNFSWLNYFPFENSNNPVQLSFRYAFKEKGK